MSRTNPPSPRSTESYLADLAELEQIDEEMPTSRQAVARASQVVVSEADGLDAGPSGPAQPRGARRVNGGLRSPRATGALYEPPRATAEQRTRMVANMPEALPEPPIGDEEAREAWASLEDMTEAAVRLGEASEGEAAAALEELRELCKQSRHALDALAKRIRGGEGRHTRLAIFIEAYSRMGDRIVDGDADTAKGNARLLVLYRENDQLRERTRSVHRSE